MHTMLPHPARRSTGRPRPARRTRHRSAAATVLLATGLLLAACAGDPDVARTPPPAPAPAPAPGNDAPEPAEEPEPTEQLAVFLVRSGPTTFYVEPVGVPIDDPDAIGDELSDRVAAAIAALLDMTTPQDVDLFTSVPESTTLLGVSVVDGIATIDLTGGIVGSPGSSSQEMTFAQQLAHTAAAVDAGVRGILLAIDGALVSELWGHLDWSVPIEADPFALSPITITTPAAGVTLSAGEITFRGEATVFEATLLVTLFGENGELLEEDFLTATAGGPERGTWEWTVTLPGAGLYTMLAEESDPSDGEGRPPFQTTRTIRAVE